MKQVNLGIGKNNKDNIKCEICEVVTVIDPESS
jgi:hypothetical protein